MKLSLSTVKPPPIWRGLIVGTGQIPQLLRRIRLRKAFDSPKKRRGFTASEIEAMEQFVRGGKGQNFARLVGKLSPQGSGLMAALGIGATAANPLLAAFPVAGMVGKSLAGRGAQNQMAAISALAVSFPRRCRLIFCRQKNRRYTPVSRHLLAGALRDRNWREGANDSACEITAKPGTDPVEAVKTKLRERRLMGLIRAFKQAEISMRKDRV